MNKKKYRPKDITLQLFIHLVVKTYWLKPEIPWLSVSEFLRLFSGWAKPLMCSRWTPGTCCICILFLLVTTQRSWPHVRIRASTECSASSLSNPIPLAQLLDFFNTTTLTDLTVEAPPSMSFSILTSLEEIQASERAAGAAKFLLCH